MRIKKFSIKNFKSVGENELSFDFSENIIALIGENNVGKSSILQALDYFFSGTKTIPTKYFHNLKTDSENAISIEVKFDGLSDNDKEHQAIKTYISEENGDEFWVLKKLYYYTEDGKSKCDYIAIVNGEEKKNPSGLTQNCDDLFTNEKMQKIFVPAVQEIAEIVDGKKETPFQKIFQLLLSEELQDTDQYKALISALGSYSELFKGETKHEKVQEIEGLITEKLKRIINAAGLIDVELPAEKKLLPIPSLSTDDGRPVPVAPSDQGHGLQRSLIFALLELYAEAVSSPDKEVGVTNLLLLEEPEIFMHPQMERKIANVLYTLAESGHVQVICTTHSPIMIRLVEKQKSLVRLIRNEENKLEAIQVEEDIFARNREEKKKTLRMVMNFDSSVKELFFAKRVVLLEGDTEYMTFPRVADLLGIFDTTESKIKKDDITLINCRSRNNIPLFQEVLNYFRIDYGVVHDLEGQSATEGKNQEILELLGNDENRRKYFNPKIEDTLEIQEERPKWLKALEKVEELNQNGTLEEKLGSHVRFIYGISEDGSAGGGLGEECRAV